MNANKILEEWTVTDLIKRLANIKSIDPNHKALYK